MGRDRDRRMRVHAEQIVYALLLAGERRADDGRIVLGEGLGDAEERLCRRRSIECICFPDKYIDACTEIIVFRGIFPALRARFCRCLRVVHAACFAEDRRQNKETCENCGEGAAQNNILSQVMNLPNSVYPFEQCQYEKQGCEPSCAWRNAPPLPPCRCEQRP
nr:MAG TPA: hypothetical protein [Caudoviricetes sp.]